MVLEESDIRPYVVITKLYPFVGLFSANEVIAHRETVYAVSSDNALAVAIEDILDVRWEHHTFDIDVSDI